MRLARRKPKTHCKYGHEIAVWGRDSTYTCRGCRAEWDRKRRPPANPGSRPAPVQKVRPLASAYDALLEEQHHQEELARTPERLLWLSVIASAVEDYRDAAKRSAERFIFGDHSALTVIAPLLGLDLEEIREAAER